MKIGVLAQSSYFTITMPFYMDIHTGDEELDPEVIRKAHFMDKAIEQKYGVKHIHYYVNSKEGMGFCLMSGPDKASCARVHQESHGNVASNIIEVKKSTYESMMGNTQVDYSDMVQTVNGSLDNGYRFVLYAELIGVSDSQQQCMTKMYSIIGKNGGRVSQSNIYSVVVSFSDCNNALYCAGELAKLMESRKTTGLDLNVGLVTGTPVTKTAAKLFEDAITLATRLARVSSPGNVLVSPSTMKFYSGISDNISSQRALSLIRTDQEEFISRLFHNISLQMESGYTSVDKLCGQMGISRPQLYRKVRALSGVGPKELIREFRLSEASCMVKSGDKNISDIAYKLGYGQPAVFSKQFKHRFGISPSEAVKNSQS